MSILTHSHYIEGDAKTRQYPLRLVLWRTGNTIRGKLAARDYIIITGA